MLKQNQSKDKSILFLYNTPNWAIHNVGQYWASILKDDYHFTFAQFGQHEYFSPTAYDYVLWGYSTLRYSGRMKLGNITKFWRLWKWRPWANRNFIAIVQDPCEIFPENENWRNMTPDLDHLSYFTRLGVTSNEMYEILKERGYKPFLVNTNSILPIKKDKLLSKEPLKIFTRANNYPRKNLALFNQLKGRYNSDVTKFDAITGLQVLPQEQYVNQIDEYNCYICTSWQEGGPIPLMDAMRRGCAILTTPVGQTDDFVKEGVNGFFCNNYEEFAEKIELLKCNPEILLYMRQNSLELSSQNKDQIIHHQLTQFLQ
jgi:hypothetical protein